MISGLDLLFLEVNSLEESVAFYEGVLGMEVESINNDSEPPMARMRGGDLRITLAQHLETMLRRGRGVHFFVGVEDVDQFYDKLIVRLIADAGINPIVRPPRGVEVAVRSNSARGLLFVINHTDQERSVAVPAGRPELLTNLQTTDNLTLAPFGVALIDIGAAGKGTQSTTEKARQD